MWVGSQLLATIGCAPAASGACVCRTSTLQSIGVIFVVLCINSCLPGTSARLLRGP